MKIKIILVAAIIFCTATEIKKAKEKAEDKIFQEIRRRGIKVS